MKTLTIANRDKTALLLIVVAVVSRLLGLIRDIVIFHIFGQGSTSDAYYAAFTLPDFFYLLLVGSALGPVLIPLLAGYRAQGQDDALSAVTWAVLYSVTIAMLLCIAVGSFFTPQFIKILAPVFDAATAALTVSLTRIMLWQGLFMALAAVLMGVLHAHDRYTAPAFGSLAYSGAIIILGLVLSPYWGIAGFALAVTAGAILYLLVELPSFLRLKIKPQRLSCLRHPGLRTAMHRAVPILIGLSVQQINLWVGQALASGLVDGTISALRLAQRLMQLPIGVFAIPIAVSIFATMSREAALGDLASFRSHYSAGHRRILILTAPCAVVMLLCGSPLIELIYENGAFTAADTARTATLLALYSIGLVPQALIHLENRAFYARGNTRTPTAIAAITVVLHIALSLLLIKSMGASGLALAYSLAAIAQWLLLKWRLHVSLKQL